MPDVPALTAGSLRLASGLSFLVAPERANRMWGDRTTPSPTATLLLHSMGYRDVLVGGLLVSAALRGKDTRGWFLASGGADAADLLGGLRVHGELPRSQQLIGIGGAVVGVAVGLWGGDAAVTAGVSEPLLRTSRGALLAAGAAAAVWLPFVARPATPDEGGYLLVASQWHWVGVSGGSGGSSLYGDYWVDRPPLLITIYQVAQTLGGIVALRLLGVVAVVVSVLLAARLARSLAPESSGTPSYAAVLTAALTTTPLFGGLNVNGELFAVPFLLAGLLALVRAVRDDTTRWWLLAGAAGAAAAMVKQSQVDLVVVGLVVAVLRIRSHGATAALGAAGRLVGGGLAVTLVLLAWAWLHGTDPGGLWEAVVAFRFDAASVIGAESGEVTQRRALGLLGAFLVSGAPLVVALLVLAWRRARPRTPAGPDPRVIATALLAWELVGVALGGSYWLHYLVGLVPGLVVAAPCLSPRSLRAAVTLSSVSALASVVVFVGVGGRAPEDHIAIYLRAHSRPGDTVTVAFGRPHIVYESDMSSPYDDLWSLPVRVRDRHLVRFTQVLAGPDRPDWLVVAGDRLRTWGITDTAAAERQVDEHYVQVARFTGYRILHTR